MQFVPAPQPTPSIIPQILTTKSSTSSADNEAFWGFNSEFSFFITHYLSALREAVSGCATSPVEGPPAWAPSQLLLRVQQPGPTAAALGSTAGRVAHFMLAGV